MTYDPNSTHQTHPPSHDEQGNAPRWVSEADDFTFEERVIYRSMQVPVLVDCWAEWCEPCKVLGPTLERLAQDYQGRFELVKVDIDRAQQVAMMLRIQSVPFMMLFVEGRPVDAIVGNQPESELRALLDRHLPPAEDDLYERGLTEFKAGEYLLAQRSFESALEVDPGRIEAHLALARSFLAMGDLQAASQSLDRVPPEHTLAPQARQLRALFTLAELQANPDELRARLEADDKDVDALYRSGINAALRGDFENACEMMLKVVMIDRAYREDAGRVSLLTLFDILGGEGDLVNRMRRRLASLLF